MDYSNEPFYQHPCFIPVFSEVDTYKNFLSYLPDQFEKMYRLELIDSLSPEGKCIIDLLMKKEIKSKKDLTEILRLQKWPHKVIQLSVKEIESIMKEW